MKKEEKISQLLSEIGNNKKLLDATQGISNDQCLSEGIDDLEQRNKYFFLLGVSLALLSYSGAIILNQEKNYVVPTEDKKLLSLQSKQVTKNKILLDLLADIVKNESDPGDSQVRYHLFLNTALVMLNNRNMISINKEWNYQSPY